MKKAAVATTAASGAAVSNSRITAVQSVYIGSLGWAIPIIPATGDDPPERRIARALSVERKAAPRPPGNG